MNGKSSSLYEAQVSKSMDGQPVISLCSYPLAKWGIIESLDVIANHRFALIKRQNRWQVLTPLDSETAKDALPGTKRLELRGIPATVKVLSISLLWITIGCSAAFAIDVLWARALLALVAIGVTAHVLSLHTLGR